MSTISVRVKFFTTLREIVGKKEEYMQLSDPATLEALLEQLSEKHGEEFEDYVYDGNGRMREQLQVLVNGKSVSEDTRMKTKLHEGDEIAILPPVGGG